MSKAKKHEGMSAPKPRPQMIYWFPEPMTEDEVMEIVTPIATPGECGFCSATIPLDSELCAECAEYIAVETAKYEASERRAALTTERN